MKSCNKLFFSKYQSSGNDFICIEGKQSLSKKEIAALCNRYFGIGGDGLIWFEPSEKGDFLIKIFNSDGGEAKMCGNGICCLALFLKDLLLFNKEEMLIETLGGMIPCRFINEKCAYTLSGEAPLKKKLSIGEEDFFVTLRTVGVPHLVTFVEEIDRDDFLKKGREMRYHPLFGEEGVNVNFASKTGEGTVAVRTYERGVELETLACGTASGAVALAAKELYGLSNPISIIPSSGITIEAKVKGENQVEILGTPRFTFSGEVSLENILKNA